MSDIKQVDGKVKEMTMRNIERLEKLLASNTSKSDELQPVKLSEIGNWIKEYESIMNDIFQFDNGLLIINAAYPYPIEWNRLKSRSDLIAWLLHLLSKNWFTTDIAERFIEIVCKHRKWEINLSV